MSLQTQPKPLRVGIFGGAFDPPHLAHVQLAQTAISQLALDVLHIVPTGHAWHKPRTLSAARHRLAMLELAFADVAHVHMDEREILRVGPSYSIDTLKQIQAEKPVAQLYLILGEDQARQITSWHRWAEVIECAIICVAARAYSTSLDGQFGTKNVPSNELLAKFCKLQMPGLAISATDIRSRVANHQNVDSLVGESVARYIDQHRLYQSNP